MTKKRNRRPQPLAPPPQSSALRSRKRARQVTTLFHKYTQERDAAVDRAKAGGCPEDELGNLCSDSQSSLSPHQVALLDEVKKWDDKLSEIGGREEYQRASQMNTSLFSTSKWVLGILGKWGWLDGLPTSSSSSCSDVDLEKGVSLDNQPKKKSKKGKIPRRDVRLLEVGAINTQLLDASERTRMIITSHNNEETNANKEPSTDASTKTERVYHLDVKAIDIRSTDPRIQQMDFFDLPLPNTSTSTTQHHYYDVIVNSMVINCVTTPAQRGTMLSSCYKHLRPGGVCFLTLPKLCLIQSKFMSRTYFGEILTKGVGFEILEDAGRESPKIAFFVLRRPMKDEIVVGEEEKSSSDGIRRWDDKFSRILVIHRGKKFRNTFAVTLNKEEVDC